MDRINLSRGYDPVADFCEIDYVPSGSIRDWKFLDHLITVFS
jgi:hypothetical protein